jgi:protoheme IX farnesyltransferase
MSLVVFTALAGLLVAPVWRAPMVAFRGDPVHRDRRGRVGRAEHVVGRRYRPHHEAHARPPRAQRARSPPGEALAIGHALSAVVGAMLGLATNWLAAALLAFTIFFYAVIYTMWLKRSDAAEHRDRRACRAPFRR